MLFLIPLIIGIMLIVGGGVHALVTTPKQKSRLLYTPKQLEELEVELEIVPEGRMKTTDLTIALIDQQLGNRPKDVSESIQRRKAVRALGDKYPFDKPYPIEIITPPDEPPFQSYEIDGKLVTKQGTLFANNGNPIPDLPPYCVTCGGNRYRSGYRLSHTHSESHIEFHCAICGSRHAIHQLSGKVDKFELALQDLSRLRIHGINKYER